MSLLTLSFCAFLCGFIVVSGVDGGEYCVEDTTESTAKSFCEYGCCGSRSNLDRRCCDAPTQTSMTYVYVGSGIGGGSGLITLLVIYWCCCRRR